MNRVSIPLLLLSLLPLLLLPLAELAVDMSSSTWNLSSEWLLLFICSVDVALPLIVESMFSKELSSDMILLEGFTVRVDVDVADVREERVDDAPWLEIFVVLRRRADAR